MQLELRISSSVLFISDTSSIYTCDVRAVGQRVTLADAVAASGRQSGTGAGAARHDVVFAQAVEKLQEICIAASSSSSASTAAAAEGQTPALVNAVDSALLLNSWQQLQPEGAAVTCSMVIKRLVSPSTAAVFVTDAAAAGNWTDVMACVRGGGVALSHCPNLVADAAAAGQTPVMLECLLRCVDVLEADVACVLTYALHSGTPAAFQSLAAYMASAPAASASAGAPLAATTKKIKGKTSDKAGKTEANVSGSADAARKALLHAALRARVSEVFPARAIFVCAVILISLAGVDAPSASQCSAARAGAPAALPQDVDAERFRCGRECGRGG